VAKFGSKYSSPSFHPAELTVGLPASGHVRAGAATADVVPVLAEGQALISEQQVGDVLLRARWEVLHRVDPPVS